MTWTEYAEHLRSCPLRSCCLPTAPTSPLIKGFRHVPHWQLYSKATLILRAHGRGHDHLWPFTTSRIFLADRR
jgi:hypothetical protein